jgi:hypothetical protein
MSRSVSLIRNLRVVVFSERDLFHAAPTACQQAVEKQASGRQPRRTAFWKAQHIHNM